MARITPARTTHWYFVDQTVTDFLTGAPKGHYMDFETFFDTDRNYVGTVTPDYHQKKALRQRLPTNDYDLNLLQWYPGPGREEKRDLDDKIVTIADFHHYFPFEPFALEGSSEAHIASNKAFKRLAAQCSQVRFNAAQFLAERKQVANLLAVTATRIAKAARALRHADLKGFMHSLSLGPPGGVNREFRNTVDYREINKQWRRVEKTPAPLRISSHWLEFQYGWKPLLSDVYNSAELLAEKLEFDQRYEGSIKSSGKHKMERLGDYNSGMNAPSYSATFEYKTRFMARYRLEDDARALLAQTGISNPLLLAWELLPYSFVVDWFLPVGTYLESLTAFDGFVLTDGSSSTVKRARSRADLEDSVYVSPTFHYTRDGGGICDQIKYVRRKLLDWPSYVLRVKSPIGGEPKARFMTAMALTAVLFRPYRASPSKSDFYKTPTLQPKSSGNHKTVDTYAEAKARDLKTFVEQTRSVRKPWTPHLIPKSERWHVPD